MLRNIPLHPLVSCIMPTHNRCCFAPQAIEYFLRQNYADKELIVIDDGQFIWSSIDKKVSILEDEVKEGDLN